MLTLSRAQIDLFDSKLSVDDRETIVRLFLEDHAPVAACFDADTLHAMAGRSIEIARRYKAGRIESCVIAMWMIAELGEAFDRHPEIAARLAEADAFPPDIRFERLLLSATPPEWRARLEDGRTDG